VQFDNAIKEMLDGINLHSTNHLSDDSSIEQIFSRANLQSHETSIGRIFSRTNLQSDESESDESSNERIWHGQIRNWANLYFLYEISASRIHFCFEAALISFFLYGFLKSLEKMLTLSWNGFEINYESRLKQGFDRVLQRFRKELRQSFERVVRSSFNECRMGIGSIFISI